MINTTIFNGTWIPVKQELGGMELPPAALANQKLIIQDGEYTVVTGDGTDKGTTTYTGNKMDIHSLEGANAGKHMKAIFEYKENLLTVCYDLTGAAYPEAFDTTGKPLYFLSVFKRQ